MHILITADTVGGVWNYTRELVTGLARRGVRVTLVSFGGMLSAEQSAWLEGLDGVRFLPTDFRLEWMQDVERDLGESAKYLRSVIRDAKPDMLHLSQFCYGAIGGKLPKLVVAHSDVMSWHPGGAWQASGWAMGEVVSRGGREGTGRCEPGGRALAVDAGFA